MARNYRYGLGWRPDLADIRDYLPQSDNIQKTLSQSQALKAAAKQLPGLRQYGTRRLKTKARLLINGDKQ